MADNTKVVSTRNLVSETSVQYVRAITLNITLVDARPNSRVWVWFGQDDVTSLCKSNAAGSVQGTLITDSIGQVNFQLKVPGGRFPVGQYEILIADTNDLDVLNTTGSVYGSARGKFTSTGKLQYFQTTETTTVTKEKVVTVVRAPVEPPKQPNLDPLAQSFFTFGVTGGMFLSSIDLFFQTKDDSIPVRVELRQLINGLPSTAPVDSTNFVSTLSPNNVYLSDDASIPTKFEFNPPVYLKEDGEYCFVVRSNSNKYNIFTSKMGENSFENGTKIFNNPYIGSLFKSENNITWTAEQSEDIKFIIRKAVFNTAGGTVNFALTVPPVIASGAQFFTTNGSKVVRYVSAVEHGLEVGSLIHIITRTAGTYNGIPGTQLNGTHTVTSVNSNTVIEFEVTSNATSTGPISTTDGVVHVMVKNPGSGYTTGDAITFDSTSGANAAATLNISSGAIDSVTMTNVGSGYTSAPNVTITSSTGSGAELVAIIAPMFTVYTNKKMHAFKPNLPVYNFGTTSTVNTLDTTIGNYAGGNLETYSPGKLIQFSEKNMYIPLDQNSIVASTYNENQWMSGTKSALVSVSLNTDNPNLSPIIDLKTVPEFTVFSNLINNQPDETLTSNSPTGYVEADEGTITSAGANYQSTPIVEISQPEYPWGIQASATATITSGSVTSIDIIEGGSGYIATPTLTILPAEGDTVGGGAAGQVSITPFNTEVLPRSGTAKARYITRKSTLQVPSTGIRLICTLSSTAESSVDWYIRTSLTGSNDIHENQNWRRLKCDTPRNKSSYVGEVFDYEFYMDNLTAFDTYDLKCVLLAQDPVKAPIVTGYRAVIVA